MPKKTKTMKIPEFWKKSTFFACIRWIFSSKIMVIILWILNFYSNSYTRIIDVWFYNEKHQNLLLAIIICNICRTGVQAGEYVSISCGLFCLKFGPKWTPFMSQILPPGSRFWVPSNGFWGPWDPSISICETILRIWKGSSFIWPKPKSKKLDRKDVLFSVVVQKPDNFFRKQHIYMRIWHWIRSISDLDYHVH